ncbi:hypothetical protein JCM10207_002315 [Rhodosporidiobolus poonsookiae]
MPPSSRASTADKASPAKSDAAKAADKEPKAADEAPAKDAAPKAKEPKDKKPRTRNPATHPPYAEMIQEAIENEGDNKGEASRPAIKKYILNNFDIDETGAFDSYIAAAIRRGADNGIFSLPKGPSGKVKLADEDDKPSGKSRSTPAGNKKPATEPRKRTGPRGTGTRTIPKREAASTATEKNAKAPEPLPRARKVSASASSSRSTKKAAPAKKTTTKRTAAKKEVKKASKPAAKKSTARKSVGAKKEAAKPAAKKPAGRKPPAARGRA